MLDRMQIGTRSACVIAHATPADVAAVGTFSPHSSQCEKNAGSVEQLARTLPPDWVLLSVATEAQGVPDFLDRHRVTVPVLTQVPEKALGPYRITRTPRTYILDKDWELLEVLDGPFQGKVAEKLENRFKVKLRSPAGSAHVEERPDGASNLCLDREQSKYSRGAKADVLGLTFRCGAGGVWIPAT